MRRRCRSARFSTKSFVPHLMLSLLIAFVALPPVWANERSLVWSRLYRRAESLSDRLALMKNAAQNPTTDLIPMLLAALDELNATREELDSTTERYLHTELSKIVIRTLGELGTAEAADAIFDVARNGTDPYLRGEAILALGRVGATRYADDVAIMLRNLNLNLDSGVRGTRAEVLAWSCVLALERLRQPVGFTPLFFASIGWYSPASGVRPKATEVMQDLMPDPTSVLEDIVRIESEPSIKLEALLAEDRSDASPEGKASVAAEALRQSLIHEPSTVVETTTYGRLRLKAMEMLIEHAIPSEQTVDYLGEVLSSGFDVNERITAILAIGSQRTEYATATLVRFLRRQNERQLAGITPADYRIIRSTIQVLGRIGDEAAVEELLAVGISNWPNSIVREAQEALDRIDH